MAKDIHDLHNQTNARPGYVSVKNVAGNSLQVSKGGVVVHPRVVYEQSTDRVIIGDGSGVAIGDATAFLASLK